MAHKHDQEELPHLRGQGRWPGGATPPPRSGAVARRSYPASEVRGGGQKELPHIQGRGSSREELPTSEFGGGGREELPYAQSQGQWPRGATLCPKPGAVAKRSNPTTKER